MGKEKEYMYRGLESSVEAERLRLLNASHNPETLNYLRRVLPGKRNILEIGCGNGELAAAVAREMDSTAKLLAIDFNPAQVESTNERLSFAEGATSERVNLLDEGDLQALEKQKPFDLIYCRWVICHIPEPEQLPLLRRLILMLQPGGQLVIDDCDNRSVCFRTKDGSPAPAYAEDATRYFTGVYDPIASKNGATVKRSEEDLLALLSEAGCDEGHASALGEYCVSLGTPDNKRMVRLGKESVREHIREASGFDPDEVIDAYRQCEEDDNITGNFLTEHVVSFTRS